MLRHATTEEEQRWDEFTLAHGGNFLQSWGWSVFQQALGREAFRFRIDSTEGEGTVAQFTAIDHRLPLGRRYMYVPRGPLVRTEGVAVDTARLNLETCIGMIRNKITGDGSVFARIEWPIPKETSQVTAEDLERWGFEEGKPMQPADTVIMDLSKDEAALLAAMHHKTRYNIRVAERHGVTVREAEYGDDAARLRDITAFWTMLSETASRDNFHTHEENYYRMMLETLRPGNGGALTVRLLLAEHEGVPISGALLADFGGTVTYLHGASVSAKRQVMAPYLLHWTAIRNAKAAGFREYDFWGVAPSDDAEHAWAGITRFKVGFGGQRLSYLGAWELPGNPLWYTLYRYAKHFRNV